MNIKEFVYSWNLMFPLDRWFREKHKIIFNSRHHRQTLLEDILFEYEEKNLFEKIDNEELNKQSYQLDKGNWFKDEKENEDLTDEERFSKALDEFNAIDLSKYDE